MKIQTLITALLIAASGAAFAQATPRLDQREANQQQRIDQGVASGQLTQKEAARLEKREATLKAHEQLAKADGVVTKQERIRLNREANRDSKAIYKQKHDRQVAPPVR